MGHLPWWNEQCPVRGYGLTHAHDVDCRDEAHVGRCCECEQNPETLTAYSVAAADEEPLQLPQPGEVGVPIMERKMATGKYHVWERGIQDYVDGDPSGPGRGELSLAWAEWALNPATRWLS